MAISYVNDLRLSEMATGDNSGTWGTVTNTNLSLIGDAMGYGTRAIANASADNITIADGTADADRAMYLKLTGGGQACTVTLLPNTVSKVWMMENGTNSALTFTQGSGANVIIPAGDTKIIASDGGGSDAIVYDVLASLSVVDLKVQDDLTVTDDASVGGDLLVSGEVQTANIGFTDGDNAMVIADGGAVTFPIASVFTSGFASNAASTITTADNAAQLTLISTDADANVGPNLRLYRNSGSPADNDVTGFLTFEGRNDNSQDVVYAQLQSYILDASDGTEDGYLVIDTMVAGTARERISFDSTSTVFNEESVDIDFRVESNGNANMLFVDGGNDRVGIGTSSPSTTLDVVGGLTVTGDTVTFTSSAQDDPVLLIQNTTNDSNSARLKFNKDRGAAAQDGDDIADIIFAGENDAQQAVTYATVRVEAADVSDGSEDGAITFQSMKAGTLSDSLHIQSGNVGIGTASPSEKLTIQSGNLNFMGGTNDAQYIKFGDTGDDDIGSILYFHGNNNMVFTTNASEAMRINSLGFVGIGTTAPGMLLEVDASNGSANDICRFTGPNSGGLTFRNATANEFVIHTATSDALIFGTGGNNERMRIDSSGNVFVGTTSSVSSNIRMSIKGGSSLDIAEFIAATNDKKIIFRNSSNSNVGNINIGSSATAFNTSSDYRLKENVVTDWDATSRLKQLKPSRFNFKTDADTTVDGFLAHEVSSIVPEAITGTKDEVDGDGVAVMQGIDQSKLVPLLVKTIQELEARITALEG